MTEAERIAVFTALGMILGGVITALVTSFLNRKNSFFQSLNNAANALNITTDELVESMLESKKLRQEIKERDRNIAKIETQYRTLKDITRKLYTVVKQNNIQPELTDDELDVLFDTQPLKAFEEKQNNRIRRG